MITTSADWKAYVNNSSVFHIKATMTGGSTLQLTDSDFMLGTASFTDSISGMNAIEFGAVVSNSFNATLNNATGKFDNWDWDTIEVYFGIVYEDESEEWIKRGTYSIDRPDSIGDTVKIQCYDAMDKLNKYFGGYTHNPPVTASRFVELICQYCNVTYGNWNIDSSWNIGVLPDDLDESTTCRQMISWVLATCGGYARINPTTNALDCNTWSRGGSWGGGVSLDGGIESPWSGADNADGGVMNPWGVVTSYDGGTMAGGGGADYTLTKIKSVTTYIDDITLTGVRAFEYNTVDSFNLATAGTDGYVINIMDNPFCNSSALQTIADRAYANMGGLTVRPFNMNAFGDPSIEAGDRISFVDSRNNQYASVITNLTFTLGSDMHISCDVEAPAENEIEKANAQTSTIKGAIVASYDYLLAKNISADHISAGTITADVTATNFHMNGGSINVTTSTEEQDVIELNWQQGSLGNRAVTMSPTGFNAQSNLTVGSTNMVGEGNYTPYSLTLKQTINSTDVRQAILNGGAGQLVFYRGGIVRMTLDYNGFAFYNSSSTNQANINADLGTAMFKGSVTAASFINSSREEIKKDIQKTDSVLSKIINADIVSYSLKADTKSDEKHIGLVISEKYNTPEEVIAKDENGEEVGVDLYTMVSMAWKAIQEQEEKIEALEKRIEELENLNSKEVKEK